MNRRKFSFDLPRLKLPFKPEINNLPPGVSLPHAMQPMDPESPGEVPKSIVPLSNDLDFALRAACTGVVRNNKPSHEYHKNGKAQLDYATIRRGGGTVKTAQRPERQEQPSAPLAKTDSNEERLQQQQGPLSATLSSPGKSQRMSNTSGSADVPQQFQEGEAQGRVQQRSRAQSRADQLMGGASPPKPAHLLRDRTNSHSRSQSTPQPSWTLPPPKINFERPKPAPRAHSMETSTPQSEATSYTWSPGTAMISTVNTPARSSSLRKPVRSSSEAQNAMKVDAYDAEWMREESERRRLLQQQAYAEAMASRHATWTGPKPEVEDVTKRQDKAPANESLPAPIVSVPARKPVASAHRESTVEPQVNLDHDFEASSPELDLSLDDPSRFDNSAANDEPQRTQRPESRTDRGRARGTNVPMNSRAASRARSITREVKEFMRNASRHRQPREPRNKQDEPNARSRSRRPSISRTRDAVVDYFRPGTSMGGTKQSLDIPRNSANLKSKSHESLISATSATSAAKDTPMQLNSQRNSQRNSQQPKQPSIYADARSRNSMEADDDEQNTQRHSSGSESKRQVDLNRALPPLPRLDSYQNDDPTQTAEFIQPPKQHVAEPPKLAQESGLASPTHSHLTRTSTNDAGKSPLPSPKLPAGAGVHDFVALRMGAPVPVSRQSSRAKMSRDQMNPNLVHQARPKTKRAPTDPRYSRIQADPSSLQSPSQISLAKRETARRRSRSVQEVNAPDLSEKLRQASANAPDGRPIHAVGQAKLVNTSLAPKESDGFASKLGRKLSTRAARTKRNITPTASQHPPVPPPHQELPQRSAKTASNTPGLSRANSDYRSENRRSLSRKMSMEEYGRMYDGRFHKHNATLTAPPPVAVSNSKSSPRIGLGNFLPHKHNPQQHHQSPQNGASKKWWHLGLGSGNGDKDTPMDEVARSNGNGEHSGGGLGVRY